MARFGLVFGSGRYFCVLPPYFALRCIFRPFAGICVFYYVMCYTFRSVALRRLIVFFANYRQIECRISVMARVLTGVE